MNGVPQLAAEGSAATVTDVLLLICQAGLVSSRVIFEAQNAAPVAQRKGSKACNIESRVEVLSHMGLSNNCLTCQDVKQLATGWPRLTSLDLSGNHVGSDGVSTIVHSHWSGLQRLALGWCALTDAFLPILVKGKWLQFVSVDLQHNEFTCPMMDCLAEASWPALQEFNLHLVTSATHNMMSDGLLLIFSKLPASWQSLAVGPKSGEAEQYALVSSQKHSLDKLLLRIHSHHRRSSQYCHLAFDQVTRPAQT